MENQKAKPMEYGAYDETKIYTPRYVSQMQQQTCIQSIYDNAPVRIYEKPIKRGTDISKQCNLF